MSSDDGFVMILIGILCATLIAFLLACYVDEMKEKELADSSDFPVYINGQLVEREYINIKAFDEVQVDYENSRILITVD